ncbi:MAG: DUF3305 domain-containing protein [Gammaproteobacteria bacterium]|jgi:hypothetical protein|nr:DUF3305 domain-containing protein [Gammaproteobacteria bacterium]
MPDSLTTPVPDAFSVSVLVEFRETNDNRWEDGRWHVAGVVAGDAMQDKALHAATRGQQFLHTGLRMRLYKDDAESYYYNLVSDNPGVFVICNQEPGEPLQPFIATLSYGEATSYMETDEIVETVAMPPELYRWAERFVLEHYVPEKRKKRKRDNWKEDDRGPRK